VVNYKSGIQMQFEVTKFEARVNEAGELLGFTWKSVTRSGKQHPLSLGSVDDIESIWQVPA
jgi:hypothetical protein